MGRVAERAAMTAPTTLRSAAEPILIGGLAEIADAYDGYIVDLWGCLHDGVRPFPAAVESLAELKRRGKRVCFLSNGPRRVSVLVRRLDEMGVPRGLYDGAMSSGEATWLALAERSDPWHARLGRRCYHLGPDRDASVSTGNGLEPVARVEDADFVLCTGIYEWDETVADHEPVLVAAAARGLPMICANPDLVVHVGERLTICAGLLAQRYEELGGSVVYHGKPHPSVYAASFALLGDIPRERVLGIGDGLRTDVVGAAGAGIDALFLIDGIHATEVGGGTATAAGIASVAASIGAVPRYACRALSW